MRFRLEHPQFTNYGFYIPSFDPIVEAAVNRLGPYKLISGTFDWPKWFTGFRGWTDTINSLWWPQGADNFSSCAILMADRHNDMITRCVAAQRALVESSTWRWPYLILSARLAPPERDDPGESFVQSGLDEVAEETVFYEWLLYPLTPINLTSVSDQNIYRGLWILPLVCQRYFRRNTPLTVLSSGSGSGTGDGAAYPLIRVDRESTPDWMPPRLTYSTDDFPPSNYVAIDGNGTHPDISGNMRWGEAVDIQARMENWRIVNRDVRSNYAIPDVYVNDTYTSHNEFRGIISDYPEDWSLGSSFQRSYHIDACNFIDISRSRIAGGLCDTASLQEFVARKLQFVFQVREDDYYYSLVIRSTTDFPQTVSDLTEDTDGPDDEEVQIIPGVLLGKTVSTRTPETSERDELVVAAKQWALLYFAWRYKQSYFRFPGIFPVIPNGHAHGIRWDFSTTKCETTYIAVEGVQGTMADGCCSERKGIYAVIDGEGSIDDGLHGYYAWTQLLDQDGNLVTHPNPKRGYVSGVNGEISTVNPARDDSGKVAVPVGLPVYLKPGVPYLNLTTNTIDDHYRFTCSDLVQVLKLKSSYEANEYGHLGAIIQRWAPELKGFVDSDETWAVLLE